MRRDKRKVLFVDLDDTLWKGSIIYQGINVKVLKYHKNLQTRIKNLKKKGIKIILCSRNDFHYTEFMYKNHPDMIFKWKDYHSYLVGWDSKGKVIKEALKKLKLEPKDAVFVDDREEQRSDVADINPGIYVSHFLPDRLF